MANSLGAFWKWFRESQTPRRPKESLSPYVPAASAPTALVTGGGKAWYVFYIPKGRMPKSFGGKSGWDWPKAYFGPFESQALAKAAVRREVNALGELPARYKIRHVTADEFAKLWGKPPEDHFVSSWSAED